MVSKEEFVSEPTSERKREKERKKRMPHIKHGCKTLL